MSRSRVKHRSNTDQVRSLAKVIVYIFACVSLIIFDGTIFEPIKDNFALMVIIVEIVDNIYLFLRETILRCKIKKKFVNKQNGIRVTEFEFNGDVMLITFNGTRIKKFKVIEFFNERAHLPVVKEILETDDGYRDVWIEGNSLEWFNGYDMDPKCLFELSESLGRR